MLSVEFQKLHLPIKQLSLAAVLKCGQSFRWSTFALPPIPEGSNLPLYPSHEYRICLRDRVVCLRQTYDTVFYRAVFPDPQPSLEQLVSRNAETLLWLKDYFQLEVDLEQLYQQWSAQDVVFAKLQDRFSGIRILRQDPWESLVSFICSSNNNISRITKMVENLCKYFSPALLTLPDPSDSTVMHTYHPFPSPSALILPSVSQKLRSLGFGYRAEYIHRTANILVDTYGISTQPNSSSEASERWLEGLRLKPTQEAREELLKFMGVGRKVADCVLLMSLDKKEVIPVDTHVHQIAIKHYGLKGSIRGKTTMTQKLYDEVNAKLMSVWGEYAGWAHSVLFTADLKSFSSYGLSSADSPSVAATTSISTKEDQLPIPLNVTKLIPFKVSKRKNVSHLGEADNDAKMAVITLDRDISELVSLADRVKKRRRLTKETSR